MCIWKSVHLLSNFPNPLPVHQPMMIPMLNKWRFCWNWIILFFNFCLYRILRALGDGLVYPTFCHIFLVIITSLFLRSRPKTASNANELICLENRNIVIICDNQTSKLISLRTRPRERWYPRDPPNDLQRRLKHKTTVAKFSSFVRWACWSGPPCFQPGLPQRSACASCPCHPLY